MNALCGSKAAPTRAAFFEALRQIRLDRKSVEQYLEDVFPLPNASTAGQAKVLESVNRHRRAARYFFEHGRGNTDPDVQGSLWAAYNGVTEYIDHRKPN